MIKQTTKEYYKSHKLNPWVLHIGHKPCVPGLSSGRGGRGGGGGGGEVLERCWRCWRDGMLVYVCEVATNDPVHRLACQCLTAFRWFPFQR